jgi:hypothetical protein
MINFGLNVSTEMVYVLQIEIKTVPAAAAKAQGLEG